MPRDILCCKEIHDRHVWNNVYPRTECPGWKGGFVRRLVRLVFRC